MLALPLQILDPRLDQGIYFTPFKMGIQIPIAYPHLCLVGLAGPQAPGRGFSIISLGMPKWEARATTSVFTRLPRGRRSAPLSPYLVK